MLCPSRKQLKSAMLAMFLESVPAKKKILSKKFTSLLFDYVSCKMSSQTKERIAEIQIEAVGLFGNYVFNKNKEKKSGGEKSSLQVLKEICDESDSLYDEIDFRINHLA